MRKSGTLDVGLKLIGKTWTCTDGKTHRQSRHVYLYIQLGETAEEKEIGASWHLNVACHNIFNVF